MEDSSVYVYDPLVEPDNPISFNSTSESIDTNPLVNTLSKTDKNIDKNGNHHSSILKKDTNLIDDLLDNRRATNRLEARVLNSFQKDSAWRVFFDNELDTIQKRIQMILESIASLQPAVNSMKSLVHSAPAASGTTAVDLYVDKDELDVKSLHQSIRSLSDDLLSIELQLQQIHSSSEGVANGYMSLSERVDALHSSLSSLCEKTQVISNYTQRVCQIFQTIFSESRNSLNRVNASLMEVRKVYERVVEVEPLIQLAPLLKQRFDQFMQVGKKMCFVEDRMAMLERRQEELEKQFAVTGEILTRVKSQMDEAIPKLMSYLDSVH